MKLNTNANGYIIIYSCLMVVIVAFLLAFVSSALKPQQDINVALDKKKQVLAALNIRDLSDSEAEKTYGEVVKKDEAFALNSSDYIEGRLAIYECEVNGAKKYVVPVYGMGLWGPIWGYVAVNDDCNTVFGAYFNHESSETAGLGAEIKDSKAWQDKFIGKTIYDANGTPVLKILKSSEIKNPQSEVDGVTGATLTSNGVSDMLQDGFTKYKELLTNKK